MLMGMSESPAELVFYREQLTHFAAQSGIDVGVLAGYPSEETRLSVLQQFFRQKSPQPDIFLIDNIWPGLLADDLLDLTTICDGGRSGRFNPKLLDAFSVNGKLLGLPSHIDFGVLYYRTSLLKKYGYSGPPKTSVQAPSMARNIQSGERKAGHADFWGYAWEGVESQSALTCNAFGVASGGRR